MQNPEQSEQSADPTDFPAYPAYKPSDVQWLGDIPSHWEVRRLRYVAEMRTSNVDKHTKMNENPVRLCNYVDVYHNERISADLDFMRATATDREIERFRLERGDVIITKDSETWNDIGVPALVEYTADDLVCGYHLALLRPFKSVITGAYLLRALQAPMVASQFHVEANGVTRYGLTQNAIKSVHIPVPPLPEQRAIAAYLDRKGAIARRYAHVARHIIDTLRELRQVEIHDAVTRGLNEDTPLKPSGVEWLGDVPEHWDVRRLKYSAKTIMGQSPSGYDCDETPIGPPFLQGCAEFQERHPKPVLYCRAPKKISPTGAILLSVRAPVGRLNIADQEYAIGRGLCAIIPDHINLDTTFAYYHLQAVTTGLRLASTGSIFDAVRLRDVRNQPIITPPLSEQRAIAEYLDAKTAAIDAAIAHYERMAELVAEYWTVLVADAVTGRIDLRQTAAE